MEGKSLNVMTFKSSVAVIFRGIVNVPRSSVDDARLRVTVFPRLSVVEGFVPPLTKETASSTVKS